MAAMVSKVSQIAVLPTHEEAGDAFFAPFRSVLPLFFARALWQIALPPSLRSTIVLSVAGGVQMSRN